MHAERAGLKSFHDSTAFPELVLLWLESLHVASDRVLVQSDLWCVLCVYTLASYMSRENAMLKVVQQMFNNATKTSEQVRQADAQRKWRIT